MKNSQIAILAGVVALLVSLGVAAFNKPVNTIVNDTLGAVTGPDLFFPYLGVNGVNTFYSYSKIRTATTTPCAFKSPSATSTLVQATIRLDVSSSTATIWDIAKASNAFATTTALIPTAYNVAAGAQAFINASTSVGQTGAGNVIAPNQFIVFGARQGITAGDTAGTGFVPSGSCEAIFVAS